MPAKPKNAPTIGEMNKKIAYQLATRTDDGGGGGPSVWTTVFSFMAKAAIPALQSSVKSIDEADKQRQEVHYVFTARYNPRVKTYGRLVYDGQTLQILTAVPLDDAKRYMTITAVVRGEVTA